MAASEFFYESVQDSKNIVEYLNELVLGFQKGEISFSNGDRTLTVRPQGLVDFELKIKSKSGKTKIEMEIEWNDKEIVEKETKLSITH